MSDDVHVHLDLVRPEEQRIRVTIDWTAVTSRQILQFPQWTPGSYTIRDPVQHLHSLQLSAASGAVPLRRLAPSQWLVDHVDPGPLSLTMWWKPETRPFVRPLLTPTSPPSALQLW